MISKIEKARRYAAEPDRIRFERFEVSFRGENDDHIVTLNGTEFSCNCHFFIAQGMGTCSHVMAMQRLLASMLSVEQQTAGVPFSFASA
jgi:predicted nucleic acid-binding Zn finger protein